MKIINIKKIKYILILTICFPLLNACEDEFLDKQPLDQLSSETFWNTESDAQLALSGVYNVEGFERSNSAKQMYSFWNQDTYLRVLEATTDNGFEKDDQVTEFNNGDMASTNNVVRQLWENSYQKITKCNNFLDNIDKVEMDADLKNAMIGEVKTIRAYEYFNLAFYWGDVPLVTSVLSVNEANNVVREDEQVVMDFVLSEYEAAIDVLPAQRPDDKRGRITQGGALALLGRAQMALEMWSEAVATYQEIISSGLYQIDPRFKELFEDGGEESSEHILTMVRMEDFYGTSILRSVMGFTWGGYHHYSPYNELVEQFECIDGLPIDQSPLYDPDNPYENRDPRLLKTIMADKVSTFRGTLYVSHPDSSASKYPDQLTRRPWSGYLLRKFMDEDYSGNIVSYGCDFSMVRYAEVLLSYLEANIEAGNPITQSLLDQTINQVRGRAEISMPPITETDPAALTTILRRERRVELAWEGLRLYDLFRWRIAHEVLDGRFHGMKLVPVAEAASYTKFPVDENGYFFNEETNFRENVDYRWPIPQTEIDVNPKLTQNPGYAAE